MRPCDGCEHERLDTEFDRGEPVCVICTARRIIALRGILGKPAFMPGEDRLRDLAKRAEKEEVDGAPAPALTDRYRLGVECRHCRRPSTPPYVQGCSRGYRTGICAGLRSYHIHVFCPCGQETLYDAQKDLTRAPDRKKIRNNNG